MEQNNAKPFFATKCRAQAAMMLYRLLVTGA